MNCPVCQTENPMGARFCMNCGSRLPLICGNCGNENPHEARFCIYCGKPLVGQPVGLPQTGSIKRNAEVTPDSDVDVEVLDKNDNSSVRDLASYMPGELSNKLQRARETQTMKGDRRVVTILFCDVKGSTLLAGQLDPEEWAEIMNLVFERLIAPVYKYEGTVARLMGDAILAFFGAPIAHEDDPQRAVLAGLEIVANLHQLRPEIQKQYGIDINIRVGINTGLVVVGDIGSDLRMEYTAMGDAVNLAARMEQTAKPGTVQISEEVHRLVAPLFDFEDLGGIDVRGKAQPVQAYRVIQPKSFQAHWRGFEGLMSPLVGREEEIHNLMMAMVEVRLGKGQIICMSGEAGIGKSRLIDEARKEWLSGAPTLKRRSPTWMQTRSLSFSTQRPYGMFQLLIRDICGVSDTESADKIREKIRNECSAIDIPDENCRRISKTFEVFLGVDSSEKAISLEGESFKRELFEALLSLCRRWASQAPLVMVFDDLHWSDPASVELLIHLFQLVEDSQILFLCAFRPERDSLVWQISTTAERDYPHRYQKMVIRALSDGESETLVKRLLENYELPVKLRKRILEKTEGNPFFVEEVIRSLIQNELLERKVIGGDGNQQVVWNVIADEDDISIPDTVQTLLMSRIDKLDDRARQTLQLASVIGRSFFYHLLKPLAEEKEDLDRQLLTLEKMDLITEANRVPELEYAFRHTLTQETIYNSILHKRRRKFHKMIAEQLEKQFSDKIEDNASLLSYHYFQARDGRALKYSVIAADHAFQLYAVSEAIKYYERALSLSNKSGDDQYLQHIYTRLGRSKVLTSNYESAREIYEEMYRRAEQSGNKPMLLESLLSLATLLAEPSHLRNSEKVQELCKEALDLAVQLSDKVAEARVYWILTLDDTRGNRPYDAIKSSKKGLAIAEELDLKELKALILNDVSQSYGQLGRLDLWTSNILEARQILRELGKLEMLADNLSSGVFVYYFNGDLEQAKRDSEEAFEISKSINNLWGQTYSLMFYGELQFLQGNPEKAIESMNLCLRLSEASRFTVPQVMTRIDLSAVLAELGLLEESYKQTTHVDQILNLSVPEMDGMVLAVISYTYSLLGRFDLAEERVKHSRRVIQEYDAVGVSDIVVIFAESTLGVMRGDYQTVIAETEALSKKNKLNVKIFIPVILMNRGIALMHENRLDEAKNAFLEACDLSEEMGTQWFLWKIYGRLSEVEKRLGNTDSSQEYKQRAVRQIEEIGGRISDKSIKESFYSLPLVTEILK